MVFQYKNQHGVAGEHMPKTFYQIDAEGGEKHAHHWRKTCVQCGTVNTCRCSQPKTAVDGICLECCEKQGIDFKTGKKKMERMVVAKRVYWHGSPVSGLTELKGNDVTFSLLGAGVYLYKMMGSAKKYGDFLYRVDIPNSLRIAPKNFELSDNTIEGLFNHLGITKGQPVDLNAQPHGVRSVIWWATEGWNYYGVDRKKTVETVSLMVRNLGWDGMIVDYPNGGEVCVIWRRSDLLKVSQVMTASEKSKCQVIYPPEPFDFKQPPEPPVVFLAGSIDMGSAEDWQQKIIDDLSDVPCVLLNPRRKDWDSSWKQDIENPKFKEQVEWELKGLEQATFIALCLTEKSKAPISLLELGLHVIGRRMLVFCPDGFWRKGNVDVVCRRYGVPVFENFEDFTRSVKARILETSAGTHEESQEDVELRRIKNMAITASDRVARSTMARKFIEGLRMASGDLDSHILQILTKKQMSRAAIETVLKRKNLWESSEAVIEALGRLVKERKVGAHSIGRMTRGPSRVVYFREKDVERRQVEASDSDSHGEQLNALAEMGVKGIYKTAGPDDIQWQAVFMVGAMGAGKSWYRTKKYLQYMRFKLIDSDEVKKRHPDYDPERPHILHEWSKEVSDAEFESVISDGTGDPVVVDGTGRDADRIARKIAMAKENGYKTFLVYVWVPLEVSIWRNRNRERFVPEKKAVAIYDEIESSFSRLKGMVDKYRVVPNFTSEDLKNAKDDLKVYPVPQSVRPPRPGDQNYGKEVGMEMAARDIRASREHTLPVYPKKRPNGELMDNVSEVGFDGRNWWWRSSETGLKNSYSDEQKFIYSLAQEMASLQDASRLVDGLRRKAGLVLAMIDPKMNEILKKRYCKEEKAMTASDDRKVVFYAKSRGGRWEVYGYSDGVYEEMKNGRPTASGKYAANSLKHRLAAIIQDSRVIDGINYIIETDTLGVRDVLKTWDPDKVSPPSWVRSAGEEMHPFGSSPLGRRRDYGSDGEREGLRVPSEEIMTASGDIRVRTITNRIVSSAKEFIG